MTGTSRKQRFIFFVLLLVAGYACCAEQSNALSMDAVDEAGELIELSAAEREVLEKLLGQGVIGRSVPARPLGNPARYFPLEDRVREFRVVSGKQTGKTIKHVLKQQQEYHSEALWRYAIGEHYAAYVKLSDDGSISLVTDSDRDKGVISRYAPVEPVILAGFKPGQSKRLTIEVKVYDLDDPDDITHTGELTLTYTYVGAYELNVPAGTYQAALIRSIYEGRVGPADVKDVQYRFFAEDVGEVARIDHTDIAAFLIYKDQSKSGKVLIDQN